MTVDGRNITFKTRPGLDAGAIAAMPGAITGAKTALTNTIAKLNGGALSPETKAFAARYFLASASGPSSSELKLIKKVLSSTLTGLSGNLTLKIGKNVGSKNKDVMAP